MLRNIIKIEIEEFKRHVKESFSIAEIKHKLGYSPNGGAGYKRINNIIRKLGLDTSHFTGQGWKNGKTILTSNVVAKFAKYSPAEIFSANSKVSRSRVRQLIIQESLIPYCCSSCNLADWLNQKLTLHLEHKNGIRNDHRLENLTFLCPNCHSLTSTYAGRNKRKRKPVTDVEIIELCKTNTNIRQVITTLGLSEGINYKRIQTIMDKHNLQFADKPTHNKTLLEIVTSPKNKNLIDVL